MKKIQLLAIATLLFCYHAFAQREITVIAVKKEMSRGMQPGFMVNIPEAKLKDVTAAYNKKLEENTKANSKEINGELINYGVVNKNFSLTPFIIYAKMLETTDGVELNAFITEDSLTFLDETGNPDKIAAVKKALQDFAAAEYRKVVQKKVDAENEKLKELKKTLEKQISDESDNKSSISKKQREIESYKSKIEENKGEQAAKTTQIANQQKMADGIGDKNSPEYNLAAKNLKKYQGDKKDLERESEKYSKSIDDNNAEIKDLEHKNEELKKQQEDSKKKIEEQEGVVKGVESVLNGIK